MKKEEMKQYRERLLALRSRLRGDVNQLADAALKKNGMYVSLVPVSSQAQLTARSGTMVPNSPRAFIGSKRTRLLKTAMNGMLVAIVDSSWIDALGGWVVL